MFHFPRDMIHSLFTVNGSGDVFLEKHWKSVISRSIVDYFFDAQVFVRSFNNILERWFFCFCRTRRPTQLTSRRSLQRPITILSQYTGWKGTLKIQWWLKTLLVHGMGQDLESLIYVTVSCSPGVTSSLWRCVWRRFLRSSSSSSFTELLTRWRTISLSAPKRSSRTTMLLYTRLSWKILSSKYFLMIERSSMRC